jgi:hypothetical protein
MDGRTSFEIDISIGSKTQVCLLTPLIQAFQSGLKKKCNLTISWRKTKPREPCEPSCMHFEGKRFYEGYFLTFHC